MTQCSDTTLGMVKMRSIASGLVRLRPVSKFKKVVENAGN